MKKEEIEKYVIALAQLNATQNLTAEEFLKRREIVNFLEKENVIELAIPKEAGKFLFKTEYYQNLYVVKFEQASATDDFYYLVKWPESQLIMDEEWFDKECHLADINKNSEVGNSAYFVPVRRMKELNKKLENIYES